MSHYAIESLESALPRFANFKLLGQGGEGAVFEIWDRIRKSDLALKLMLDSGEPDLGHRFEHEYGILASSRSDRLVRVFDHGQEVVPVGGAAFNHSWYTMEKCENSVRSTYRRMPLAKRLDVVYQMLDGLAFLHAKDIAHRDIKPDNIFLVKGKRVTVYELLSAGGAPLDFGLTQETCYRAHWTGAVFPLRIPELGGRLAPAVDWVLGRMLAKRVEERYPDLAECKRELAAALAQEGVAGGGR